MDVGRWIAVRKGGAIRMTDEGWFHIVGPLSSSPEDDVQCYLVGATKGCEPSMPPLRAIVAMISLLSWITMTPDDTATVYLPSSPTGGQLTWGSGSPLSCPYAFPPGHSNAGSGCATASPSSYGSGSPMGIPWSNLRSVFAGDMDHLPNNLNLVYEVAPTFLDRAPLNGAVSGTHRLNGADSSNRQQRAAPIVCSRNE